MSESEPRSVDLVVLGLGYVGLPLACEATRSGIKTVGFDPDEHRVASLNEGRSHVDDVSDADVAEIVAQGFRATSDPAVISSADVAVICVPTPLSQDGTPDLTAVTAAGKFVRSGLHAGMLVVLESTTYPGTTEEVLRPLLEEGTGLSAGVNFHLAYSPERIDPGNETYGFRNTPKVVGGLSAQCGIVAERFYSKIVDRVFVTRGTREAETAKLLENTYRHVNIALVNEMAVFCDELDIDLWNAIEAASTKPFGFQPFYPGPGVGGHCIPIDPNYLSYRVRQLGYPFRFVELAQEVNARMPAYVVSRASLLLNSRRQSVNGARVLLVGVTYKPGVSDVRESPAAVVAERFAELGAELSYHDPYVAEWSVGDATLACEGDLIDAVTSADLVVLLQHHPQYDLDELSRSARLILDTRGRATGDNVERL